MAKLDLASSEWCQLIFEGKNQAYGAYRLRANSTKRHNVAMLIVVIIAAVGFSIPTLLKLATPEQKEVMTEVTTLSKLEEPEIKQEEMKRVEPVAPPPPALKRVLSSLQLLSSRKMKKCMKIMKSRARKI